MNKKQERLLKQQELLKNFAGDFYQEKKVGDNWLIKMFNKDNGKWQVAVYSENLLKDIKIIIKL